MSSRNQKLNKKQFNELIIFNSNVRDFMGGLEPNMKIIEGNKKAKEFIRSTIGKFDYFEFRNSQDLNLSGTLSQSRLFYAIYIGKVRLIDNFTLNSSI